MTHPLLADWTGPHALPPFDAITAEMFPEAFDTTLDAARAQIAAIADAPDAPSFDNTIAALESADTALNRVLAVFFTLAGTCATPELEKLQRELSPRLADYSSEVARNSALFARIETLWEQRDSLDLTPEQARLLEQTRRGFTRGGAALAVPARDRLAEVTKRLAELGTAFTQNLLADERDWTLPLSEDTLATLPGWLAEAARAAGAERDLGPVLTLSRSLLMPFLTHAPDRALRETALAAWTARGANPGATDNRPLTAEILALRAERAALLGYDSFAAFKLEPEMAKTPDAVRDLLMQVWTPARAAAERDAVQLATRMEAEGGVGPLEAWDWRYYAEKRRAEEHDLSDEQIKPYFQLDQMIAAAFAVAERLFGLKATPLDVPLWHDDVRAWEITRDGRHMAVFMGDYFARPGKRSGAWCSTLRPQHGLGAGQRAHVVNVCNFAKPPAGRPALLSYDDARTLFHEFGHALHNILSEATYPSLAGTHVARDFVELPSQLYEHWLEVPEVLAEFATHFETGAPMPEDLRARLLAGTTWDMGFQTVEYLASALVDLSFHEGAAPADPMQEQARVLEDIGMPRAIPMRHATPQFQHVFAGDGYAAGYYSYMWSEVMDADAFAAFKEAGGAFDPEVARRLQEEILSRGDTRDPAESYLAFRGAMPDARALLEGRGLV